MNPKELANKLNADGKCIVCGTETPNRRRGLCVTDYSRFRSALLQVSPDKRAEFDRLAVESGKLLPSKQGQRPEIDDDVFSALLDTFRKSDPSSVIDRTVAEIESAEREMQIARTGRKKPRKKTKY